MLRNHLYNNLINLWDYLVIYGFLHIVLRSPLAFRKFFLKITSLSQSWYDNPPPPKEVTPWFYPCTEQGHTFRGACGDGTCSGEWIPGRELWLAHFHGLTVNETNCFPVERSPLNGWWFRWQKRPGGRWCVTVSTGVPTGTACSRQLNLWSDGEGALRANPLIMWLEYMKSNPF